MQVRAVEVPEQDKNDKAWMLLRYRIEDGKLVLELTNFSEVCELVNAGKLPGVVGRETVGTKSHKKGDITSVKVTASTEELTAWLTKNADDKKLCGEFGTYTAVPEPK